MCVDLAYLGFLACIGASRKLSTLQDASGKQHSPQARFNEILLLSPRASRGYIPEPKTQMYFLSEKHHPKVLHSHRRSPSWEQCCGRSRVRNSRSHALPEAEQAKPTESKTGAICADDERHCPGAARRRHYGLFR